MVSASPPFLGRPASRSHSTLTPENPERGPRKVRGEDLESLFGHWHQACEHRHSQHPRVACIADTPSGQGGWPQDPSTGGSPRGSGITEEETSTEICAFI